MVWSCALALGLVWSLLTQTSFPLLWVLLGLPGLALPLNKWKRALPWILAGWIWGTTLQWLIQAQQRDEHIEVTTEWVCIRPTFLPPVAQQDARVDAKGIWEGVDAKGRRFRCWPSDDAGACR